MAKNKKTVEKQNKPFYMENNDMIKVDEKIKEKVNLDKEFVPKFNIQKPESNDKIFLSLDGSKPYQLTKPQLHALTSALINASKFINPDKVYSTYRV